jgi:2-succinyl-5-enolpyruvyl-6-hydroxy-3-cyclohexene-1-carboxylate synthase
LPSMVEAYYSSVPLIAVTADRPRAYRGSGAPQTIDQAHLFGTYATATHDLERPEDVGDWPAFDGPCHINVCFSEPLLSGWTTAGAAVPDRAAPVGAGAPEPVAGLADVVTWLEGARAPLVIIGGLHEPGDRDLAARFCRSLGAPVLAEASSGLRSARGLRQLGSGDAAVQRGFSQGLFDSVLRIGDVPSFRVWRDLDLTLTVPVLSVSRKPWRGLTRGTHVHVPAW